MKRLLTMLALFSVLAAAAWADIGPQPPIGRTEVDDPQKWLAMKSERVDVVIDGGRASVTASFDFKQAKSAYRETIAMRVGFPQLSLDRPLKDFKVFQAVYDVDNSYRPPLTAVTDLKWQKPAEPFAAGLKADWQTWPVEFLGHNGRPTTYGLLAKVQYVQDLTPVGQDRRFTYVLRSGAPWSEPIGSAEVNVRVKKATLLSATPGGAKRRGDVWTWKLKAFEPVEDVVIRVKPTP